MSTILRSIVGLFVLYNCAFATGQTCDPTTPRADAGTSFGAFAPLERLEVRSGRPGHKDWEWGLGINTQQDGSFGKQHLNWVSGRAYRYVLTYDGKGAGSFAVLDGSRQLFTGTWDDPERPLRAGNALKFYVSSSEGTSHAAIRATVATINGLPAAGEIETERSSAFSEQAMYWFFPPMASGFTVTGTVTLIFPGRLPTGSRLSFLVTAGTIACRPPGAPPGIYFIHVDHLNTPRLVADTTGTTAWRWDSLEPFGDNVPDENPSRLGVLDLPLRLPGQYFDKETNLHYNYFRDYDPAIGRYGESDPIGMRGGLNTYTYVFNRPLDLSDPRGLDNPGMGPYGARWSYGTSINVNGTSTTQYTDQDWVCTSPAGFFEGFGCTKQCCIEHDACYERYRCNETSWAGPLSSSCQRCNTEAVRCILSGRPNNGCIPGCSTTFNEAP